VLPSGRRTDVAVLPATTWALVTITSGAGENPLPATRTPHARPLTRTVDAMTWLTTAGGRGAAGAGAGGNSRARRLPRTSSAFDEGAAAAWVRAAGAAAGPASTMGTTRKRDRNRATTAGRRWAGCVK